MLAFSIYLLLWWLFLFHIDDFFLVKTVKFWYFEYILVFSLVFSIFIWRSEKIAFRCVQIYRCNWCWNSTRECHEIMISLSGKFFVILQKTTSSMVFKLVICELWFADLIHLFPDHFKQLFVKFSNQNFLLQGNPQSFCLHAKLNNLLISCSKKCWTVHFWQHLDIILGKIFGGFASLTLNPHTPSCCS